MTNLFGGARDDPDKKPELEDFNSTKVASEVRMQCLTHKATILPFAGSVVGLGWSLIIHVSAVSAGLTVAGIFIGTSAFIWNYFVNGEKKVQARYARLMQAKRNARLQEFLKAVEESKRVGFVKGGLQGEELKRAFDELNRYIGERGQKNGLINSFRIRAEAAFEQGCSVLEHALNVYKAMQTLDVQDLETELGVLKAGLAQITDDDEKDLQNRHINTVEQRIASYRKKEKQLKELLTLADEIEAALKTTQMGLLELGTEDPTAFLSEDGDAAQQLVSAFEAAKRVEARLRGGDDAASRERSQMLMAAADE